MNILFLNSIDPDVWGGGEKWMLITAIGLRKKNHSIYFSGRKNSFFLKHAEENDFPVFPLNIKSDLGPGNIFRLVNFYKTHQINVIIPNFNKDVRLTGIAKLFVNGCTVIARNLLSLLMLGEYEN